MTTRLPEHTAGGAEPRRPTAIAAVWVVRALLAAVPLVLGGRALHTALRLQERIGFPMDDPYIHLQFARNLAHGAGFAFNPGEPSPGSTSPLWVVLLAGGHALGAPLEWLAIVLGLMATGAAAVLMFEVGIAAGLSASLACLASLGVASGWRVTWASLSGMEIMLAIALSLILLHVHLRAWTSETAAASPRAAGLRRLVVLGILAGLCAQARPEMLLLAAVVGVFETRRHRSVIAPIAFATGCLVVLLPYVVFCLLTAGRPLPNTFYAKTFLPLGQSSFGDLRSHYMFVMARLLWSDNRFTALLMIPGIATWATRRRYRHALVILLWPVLFWCYAIAVSPFHYNLSRYTIPLLPCLGMIALAPVDALVRYLARPPARRLVLFACGLAVVAGSIYGHRLYGATYQLNVDNILKMQVRMGAWVAANLRPEARIATNDVGAITYYGNRYCIDTWGLVSSGFITHELHLKSQGPFDYEYAVATYFQNARPDYCILFPSRYPHLTRQPWLREIHRITYPNNTGGGNDLVVYQVNGPILFGR